MKVVKFSLLILALLLVSCDKDTETPSRAFHMGFTPFPYANSINAVTYTYEKIATNSDIINHHFDNGVPWVEALAGTPFHENVMNDWNYRKEHTPAGHKVYLSVTALSFERTTLARYRGASDNEPLPGPWSSYGFANEEVRIAYKNYCRRIIQHFQPDFFNMNVEANLLFFTRPEAWSDFLGFHKYVYESLKSEFPDLVIFSSVTGAQLLEGFFPGKDHVQQRLAVLQIMEYSDVYALSFYPYLSAIMANPYPANVFETLFTLTSKPVAIAETGYPAETFELNTGTETITIEGNEQKQNKFVSDLLEAAEKHQALFVINFVVRDYDELWREIGSPNDINIAWRDTGLFNQDGTEREGLATWSSYFSKKYQRY